MASTILATVQISSEDVSDSLTAVNELLERETRDVPPSLWWQLGQQLESRGELQPLAIAVLEDLQRDRVLATIPSNGGDASGFYCGIGAKLANAYILAGQTERARRHLIHCCEHVAPNRALIAAERADDIKILTYQRIADHLKDIGAPLDAMYVYSHALSQPEIFRTASRLPGRTNYFTKYSAEWEKLTGSLEPIDYRQFLDRISDEIDDAEPVNLLALDATQATTAWTSSIAAMVIHELSKTEEGLTFLRTTRTRLDGLSKRRADDWSLLALRAMIAAKLKTNDAVTLLASLRQRMADPQIREKILADGRLGIYSPALAAMAIDDKAISEQGFHLASQVTQIAKSSGKDRLVKLLSTAQLRAIGSTFSLNEKAAAIQEMLDAAIPLSDPPQQLSSESAEVCLELAELSLDVGTYGLAAEAIHRGFAGGPPILPAKQKPPGASPIQRPDPSRFHPLLPFSRRSSGPDRISRPASR